MNRLPALVAGTLLVLAALAAFALFPAGGQGGMGGMMGGMMFPFVLLLILVIVAVVVLAVAALAPGAPARAAGAGIPVPTLPIPPSQDAARVAPGPPVLPPAPRPLDEKALVLSLSEDERLMYVRIREVGGAVLQSEIVRWGTFSKPKVTRVLDRLEGRGLVVRERRGMTNRVRLLPPKSPA